MSSFVKLEEDATVDRLDEIDISIGDASIPQDSWLQVYQKKYELIMKRIEEINLNTKTLQALLQKERTSTTDRKEIHAQADTLTKKTFAIAAEVKKQFEKLKEELSTETKIDEKAQTKNMFNSYGNRFIIDAIRTIEAIETYKNLFVGFQKCVKERDKQAVKIVAPSLSDEQAEKIVENGETKFITGALVSDDLQGLLKEFEERQSTIKALEQEVLEVFELFKELNVLVEQQEGLDSIENHITNATGCGCGNGEEELEMAERYYKKKRKCKLMLLGFLVVILIVIVLLITRLL